MPENQSSNEKEWVDYYEVLQLSTSADPETIHRVYRILAQRYHPDNQETGNDDRFRAALEAYRILSDPEQRARYDVAHQGRHKERARLITAVGEAENDFQHEQIVRLSVLEALYTQRRMEPDNPGIFWLDIETLVGHPREHLEFTLWFLLNKKLAARGDNSRVHITVEGVEYLEQNYRSEEHRKRLPAAPEETH